MIMRAQCSSKAESWKHVLCPKKKRKFEELEKECRTWHVRACNDCVFEVIAGTTYIVNIDTKSCSCHEWDVSRFLCTNVVCVLLKTRKGINDYVEDYFKVDFWRKSYADPIYPVPDITTFLDQ